MGSEHGATDAYMAHMHGYQENEPLPWAASGIIIGPSLRPTPQVQLALYNKGAAGAQSSEN